MGTGRIKIAGLQIATVKGDKEANIARAEALARKAAAEGAQLLVTPEVFVSGFVGGLAEEALAETIPGPTTDRFAKLARELGVHLVIGLSERHPDGGIANALAVLSDCGELLGVLRKVHINKFELGQGWRNGEGFPVVDIVTATGRCKTGAMICYDAELPESARLLILQGADLILSPCANRCTTRDISRCTIRVRALESEAPILVVNHAEPALSGHSMFIDHEGNITQELRGGEGVLITEIDFDKLAAVRADGYYGLHHRRPQLYGLLADSCGQIHPENANLPEWTVVK
ncbi:MAG TPA: carbon-nitrogen hydrolase family protein [Planctomycetota bacterium]|nr:carbon-nitrogen hydrolase family protein [Planctomycetota bacterium]